MGSLSFDIGRVRVFCITQFVVALVFAGFWIAGTGSVSAQVNADGQKKVKTTPVTSEKRPDGKSDGHDLSVKRLPESVKSEASTDITSLDGAIIANRSTSEFKPLESRSGRIGSPYYVPAGRAPDYRDAVENNTDPVSRKLGRSDQASWTEVMESAAESARQSGGSDGWRFSVEPYLWLPLSARGELVVDPPDMGVGPGVTVPIDIGPSDIFSVDQLFAMSGRFEAKKDRYGLIFDAFYLGVGTNTETTFLFQPVGVQVDLDTFTFDAAGSWRFGDQHPFREDSDGGGWLEPFAGARIRTVKLATRITPGSTFDSQSTWIEPLIGVSAGAPLNEKFVFDFRFDYSGFGIDSASNYTYNVVAGIDWRICKRGSVKAAYRRYGTDIERIGRNGRNRDINIAMDGLWVGFVFRF